MRKLFVTDLDGTLLRPDLSIDAESVKIINELISKGMLFTCATARTPATVMILLSKLNVSLPLICMNGALLWDKQSNMPFYSEAISRESAANVEKIIRKYNRTAFAFEVPVSPVIHVYYLDKLSKAEKLYLQDRLQYKGKRFSVVDSYSGHDYIYFSMTDRTEALAPIYNELARDDNIRLAFYADVYNEGCSYLEVQSAKASKAEAIKRLKTLTKADGLCVFGDNTNDLPMFELAEERYAVANAINVVKEKADTVIGSNTEGGVARKLLEIFK